MKTTFEDQFTTAQKVEEILKETKNSSFRKEGSGSTVPLKNLNRVLTSFSLYTDYEKFDSKKEITIKEFKNKIIPGFQRDSNKWTLKMQRKFIENILSGFRTEIKLFRFAENEDAQIIDGLQRLTALISFLNNEFSVYDDIYFKDIEEKISYFRAAVVVTIYTFSNWEEVAKFYIDMNENITHSKEDIEKAKMWFRQEKNIEIKE